MEEMQMPMQREMEAPKIQKMQEMQTTMKK